MEESEIRRKIRILEGLKIGRRTTSGEADWMRSVVEGGVPEHNSLAVA